VIGTGSTNIQRYDREGDRAEDCASSVPVRPGGLPRRWTERRAPRGPDLAEHRRPVLLSCGL
jgi:hypothetical protein